MPGKNRGGESGNRILGEVSGNTIIIYDKDYEGAESTLIHEFCEYQFDKVTRPLIDYVNNQNELIERLMYLLREDVVEKFTNGFK